MYVSFRMSLSSNHNISSENSSQFWQERHSAAVNYRVSRSDSVNSSTPMTVGNGNEDGDGPQVVVDVDMNNDNDVEVVANESQQVPLVNDTALGVEGLDLEEDDLEPGKRKRRLTSKVWNDMIQVKGKEG